MVAGRYLLQNTIGRGAMGTVWRARDTVLARDVAVKEVRLRGPVTAGSVMTEETRILYQRTLREARTAARLNHPAVVTVFDVVEADGSPWIVMELVQARSLDQILTEDGPLQPQQAADVGRRVLGGLACAHAAGILHRDVKPSNVLLGRDGRVVLTDFGIATLEGDTGLTQAGMVMGTPGFTAPERIRGDAASPASDLWSLGATLFAAVEGHGPFDDRGNSIAILAAIANEEAPRPRSAGPLRHVIEALLHRNPRGRPDTAAVSRLLAAAGMSTARTGLAGASAAGASAALTGADGAGAGGAGADRSGAGGASAGGAGAGAAGAGGAAGIGTPRDAGRRRAGEPLLTAPLGLAMPGPRAQPHAAASGISQPGTPGPDGPWEGPDDPWPEGPWPGGPPQPGDAPWASQIPPSTDPPTTDPPTGGPQAAGAQSARVLAVLALAARVESARTLAARVLAASALAARELAARTPASRTPPPGPGATQTPAAGATASRTPARGPGATRTPAAGAGRHGAPAPGLRRGLAADITALVPRGRRGKLLVILGALAIVVAGILAGMALTHGGSGSGSAAPPARQAGSTAGFTMAIPAGWHTAQQGASTKFSGPARDVSILVTPTSAGDAQGLGQTRLLLARALKRGNFPGYLPIGGRPFSFQGRAGVAWLFTWQPASGGRREVRDIVFRAAAPGGGRAYLVQESAPVVAWPAYQPEFMRALSTFRTSS
jgi:hypothetical protein